MDLAAAGAPILLLRGGQQLRSVSQHEHLGIATVAGKSVEPELATQILAGRVAAVALSQRDFGSQFSPDATKSHVATATVASRVLYAAVTWPALSLRQYRRVEAVMLQPLRRAATYGRPRGAPHQHLSNEDVRTRFRVPLL